MTISYKLIKVIPGTEMLLKTLVKQCIQCVHSC